MNEAECAVRYCNPRSRSVKGQEMAHKNSQVKVLAFDVFGTVVDWHTSIAREVECMGLGVDGNAFSLAWRAGYKPAMQRIMSGELGWTLIDDLHRMILDDLLAQFRIAGLDEEQKRHLNKVWHRLDAWPDSVEGLTRLKSRYTICSLSNGNIGLLTDMAKNAGLPWDCILSAEIFKKYKPDPVVYLGAAKIFDVSPEEVMMVAAHQDDLAAARAAGLKTAYIERPHEFGKTQEKDISPNPENTLHAASIVDLAVRLGC
jgi:2-haloacid dehalogenase